MHRLFLVLLSLYFLFTAPCAIADEWDKAEAEIRRLVPEELREVPEVVRKFAAEHGCTVPQFEGKPSVQTNILFGEFAAPGQTDWAFLCSASGSSEILVRWGGPVQCPFKFGAAPDRSSLEGSVSMHNGQVVRRIQYLREAARRRSAARASWSESALRRGGHKVFNSLSWVCT